MAEAILLSVSRLSDEAHKSPFGWGQPVFRPPEATPLGQRRGAALLEVVPSVAPVIPASIRSTRHSLISAGNIGTKRFRECRTVSQFTSIPRLRCRSSLFLG